MRKEMLNVAWLNGATPKGKGGASGSGGVTINNQDKTVDIADNGTTKITADSGYTGLGTVTVNTNVKAAGGDTPSRPTYTGHADVEGLKAIGWTDEDIAYYQANGVNWNEEDDQYHKVPEDNIALYGVLTPYNISNYRDKIVYLPKIDTSSVTSISSMFYECYSLVSIPYLDTSKATNMHRMFYKCHALTSIPHLDTSKVTNMKDMFFGCHALTSITLSDTSNVTSMEQMFRGCHALTSITLSDTSNVTNMEQMFSECHALTSIPHLDTSKAMNMYDMFYECHALTSIPHLDTSKATNMKGMFYNCHALTSITLSDTSNVTSMEQMFRECHALTSIPHLDTSKVTSMYNMFYECYSLVTANLKNVKLAYQLNYVTKLSKASLLYIINNEASTSAITIKLASDAYTRLAEDADVVAALSNHPNISLAK